MKNESRLDQPDWFYHLLYFYKVYVVNRMLWVVGRVGEGVGGRGKYVHSAEQFQEVSVSNT